jgi:hypothetical protein
MPALALVTRDMLHRGAARFADELGKAGLVHSMPARRNLGRSPGELLEIIDNEPGPAQIGIKDRRYANADKWIASVLDPPNFVL